MSYLIVFTTVPNLRVGRKLASILLDKQVAACINITPAIESHYTWKGKKKKDKEYLLLIKTRSSLFRRLERLVLQNHPYDVPELIAAPIRKGNRDYLKWIFRETKP